MESLCHSANDFWQLPSAGVCPCGSPQGWQRVKEGSLAFNWPPGTIFLLSIFLGPHIIFPQRDVRKSHSSTF